MLEFRLEFSIFSSTNIFFNPIFPQLRKDQKEIAFFPEAKIEIIQRQFYFRKLNCENSQQKFEKFLKLIFC